MAYKFNDKENEITKLLPAYIFNYSDNDGKGLFIFIKYLTNYIETANSTLDTICSELNVNSDNTYILDILARKLGTEIPTTITEVEDKQTVLKGKIMTLSSTGCAQALIDTIYGLYPTWHDYDSFGTPIKIGDTIDKLFYNTAEKPKLEDLGWDNADETTTTTDEDGFETVTKILNALVSTTGPVVQLVYKKSNGLEGYSVIVHYTTESDDVNVISYKDKYTCDIEDLVDSNNNVTVISPEIDKVRSFIANQNTFYAISNNTYNYPDATDIYYNSYRTIEYTTNWENYTWQNLPNNIIKGDIWQDNDGNIYASQQTLQCKLNKQTFTWEPMVWKGLTSFYRDGIWTDGKKMYYSGSIWNSSQSKWEDINYELGNDYTWIPKTWKGLDTLITDGGGLRGSDIWTDGEKIYCSTQFILSGGTTKYYNYVLNTDTSTWTEQKWEGITNIQTGKLFHYKDQVLYCLYFTTDFTTLYYTLDIGTNKWEPHNWPKGIYINAIDIWSDGNDYYCLMKDASYKLNQTSFTWEPITWTGLEDISIATGRSIWHFDNNVFYAFTKRLATVNSDKVIVDRKRLNSDYQAVFTTPEIGNDGDFQREEFKDPNNTSQTLPTLTIYGRNIWKNSKGNVYYNDRSRSLFFYRQTRQFENKTWTLPEGTELKYGSYIYTIGDNIYYTYSADDTETPTNLQLISSSAWDKKDWENDYIRDGRKVWKTKNNVYYGSTHKFTNIKPYFSSKSWTGYSPLGSFIWKDRDNIYYSYNGANYKLNKSNSEWVSITWKGLNDFKGNLIWSDGNDTYYSNGSSQYRLNRTNLEWVSITAGSDIWVTGDKIWYENGNIYYSNTEPAPTNKQFKFNKSTKNWDDMSWEGLTAFSGEDVWEDNYGNIYYSAGTTHYKRSKNSTNKWVKVNFSQDSGLSSFYGRFIWKTSNDTYYSPSSGYGTEDYKLIQGPGNLRWVKSDLTHIVGTEIWSDNENIYYSNDETQYILEYSNDNNNPKKAISITWSNLPDKFDTINIWRVGDKTYYSDGNIHKIINEDTMSFDDFTEWKGLTDFYGYNVWESKNNIYYNEQNKGYYILDKETYTWLPKSWVSNHIKDNSEISSSNYIWSDGIRTYYSNNYVLNDYKDSVSVVCSFTDNKLSVKSQLTRKYTVNPLYYPIRLQEPSYALDMIKLPNKLLGWHSPDGISSPVAIRKNATDNPLVPAEFNIVSEKYQNEWGRYIDKDADFNPIINYTVSVIDEGSLLQGAKNMHYKVIIGGVDKDGNPGPILTEQEKIIITKYLIPKFLGVGYEVEFKQ